MANLKEIRSRISSVISTRQITSAMKMVSAAKLRKAQDAIMKMRPYSEKLQEILLNIASNLDSSEENGYTKVREPEKILLVVITSNKGLCGAFNSNVIKKAILAATEKYEQQLKKGNVEFIAIGKKGNDFLRTKKYKIVASHGGIFDKLSFENALPVVNTILDGFLQKKYDRVELIYNQFKNAASQKVTQELFLPVTMEQGAQKKTASVDYIFEPSEENIVKELIPKSLRIQFYKALLDSNAGEHGARMTAMHQATDNATALHKELLMNYNKARQASITNEILEIVTAANALSSK